MCFSILLICYLTFSFCSKKELSNSNNFDNLNRKELSNSSDFDNLNTSSISSREKYKVIKEDSGSMDNNSQKSESVILNIYFIRHGVAKHNIAAHKYPLKKLFSRNSNKKEIIKINWQRLITKDSPLSKRGIRESKDLHELILVKIKETDSPKIEDFKNLEKPHIVFSSPMRRTIQTAYYSFPKNKEIIVAPHLKEIIMGNENAVSSTCLKQKFLLGKEISNKINYKYVTDYKGLKFTENARNRKKANIKMFLSFLRKNIQNIIEKKNINHNNEINIAVITHSGIIGRDIPKKQPAKGPYNNAIIKQIYEYNKETKKLIHKKYHDIPSFKTKDCKAVIFEGFRF